MSTAYVGVCMVDDGRCGMSSMYVWVTVVRCARHVNDWVMSFGMSAATMLVRDVRVKLRYVMLCVGCNDVCYVGRVMHVSSCMLMLCRVSYVATMSCMLTACLCMYVGGGYAMLWVRMRNARGVGSCVWVRRRRYVSNGVGNMSMQSKLVTAALGNVRFMYVCMYGMYASSWVCVICDRVCRMCRAMGYGLCQGCMSGATMSMQCRMTVCCACVRCRVRQGMLMQRRVARNGDGAMSAAHNAGWRVTGLRCCGLCCARVAVGSAMRMRTGGQARRRVVRRTGACGAAMQCGAIRVGSGGGCNVVHDAMSMRGGGVCHVNELTTGMCKCNDGASMSTTAG